VISRGHPDINVDWFSQCDNFVWLLKPPGYLHDHPKSPRRRKAMHKSACRRLNLLIALPEDYKNVSLRIMNYTFV
jgi:hypothetical protein